MSPNKLIQDSYIPMFNVNTISECIWQLIHSEKEEDVKSVYEGDV